MKKVQKSVKNDEKGGFAPEYYPNGPFSFSLWQICSDEMSRTAADMDKRFFASDREFSLPFPQFARILIFDLKTGKNAGFYQKSRFFNISSYESSNES